MSALRLELVAVFAEFCLRLGIEPEHQHAVGSVGVVAGAAVKGPAGPCRVVRIPSLHVLPMCDVQVASKTDVDGALSEKSEIVRGMRCMANQAFALGNWRVAASLVGKARFVVARKAQLRNLLCEQPGTGRGMGIMAGGAAHRNGGMNVLHLELGRIMAAVAQIGLVR